jgi:uncharacterized protein involved in exopolysaccharide biosynthesis
MNQEQDILQLKQQVARYESMNSYQDDEIDLKELWNVIWQGKWKIIFITMIFSVASVFYALSLPNIYKSEALLAPAEEQSGGLGGMASQLGGLASLAGVNLGAGKSDKTSLALEIMKSRAFLFKFIEKYDITANLMAVKSWNSELNQLHYDQDVYNYVSNEWGNKDKGLLNQKPSLQAAYRTLKGIINIEQSPENSMVTISIEHLSPYIAQQWVMWFIDGINEEMKSRDLLEAQNAIGFLNTQLETTRVSGLQEIIYQLIEEQTKTIMFASVRDEYVLKTIDPALAPELKSGPQRPLICMIGFILGFILSVLIVLIRHFNYKN